MKSGKELFRHSPKEKPIDVLQRFIGVFEDKGWLNQTVRIKRHGKRYRIRCSQKEFVAYRINDHGHVLPGFPGWSVCLITSDSIFEDSDLSAFRSTEPGAYDWLRCIIEGDFELI